MICRTVNHKSNLLVFMKFVFIIFAYSCHFYKSQSQQVCLHCSIVKDGFKIQQQVDRRFCPVRGGFCFQTMTAAKNHTEPLANRRLSFEACPKKVCCYYSYFMELNTNFNFLRNTIILIINK